MKKGYRSLVLLALALLAGCSLLKHAPTRPASERAARSVLPGRWLLLHSGQKGCTYALIAAQPGNDAADQGQRVALPCSAAHVHIVGEAIVALLGPCPVKGETDTCWAQAPLKPRLRWQRLPLESPVFFRDHKALYPCGHSDGFVQWCAWDFRLQARSRAYPRIHPPRGADLQALRPLAWSPPWLLMGEELPCKPVGGKALGGFARYWLVNLVTGLPSPWQVWEAVGAQPRCLRTGDAVQGYTLIAPIGWSPAREGELAFAVQRFDGGSYQKPLYAYPFQTDLYLWGTNGKFLKVGTFPRLNCRLWAPDGSGWLCEEIDAEGNASRALFLRRDGKVVLRWPKGSDRAVVQWLP